METFSEGKGGEFTNPAVGDVCGALYTEDESWYRARILSVQGDQASVQFVDYGNCSTVPVESLKTLPDHLLSFPPYALDCSLRNLSVVPGQEDQTFELLDSLVQEKELTCVFSGTPTAINVIVNTEDSGDIATVLLESGLVLKEPDVEQILGDRVEQEVSAQAATELNAELIQTDETPVDVQADETPVEVQKILLSENPVGALVETSSDETKSELVRDEAVIVSEDDTSTGVDISVVEDSTDKDEIYESSEETSEKISEETSENVSEGIKENILEKMKENISEGPKENNMEETKENILEDTEKNTSEGTNENIFQGTNENISEVHKENFLEGTNENISAETNESISEGTNENISEETTKNISEGTDEKSLDKKLLKLPVLPSGPQTCFTSHVSTIESFHLQLTNQEEALGQLSDQLNNFFADGAGEQLENPTVGMNCCSQFSEDGSWYRASITSIEGSKATVFFIDYGNSDVVELSSLKSPVEDLRCHPPFAWKCRLANLVPVVGKENETNEVFLTLTKDAELVAVFSCRNDSIFVIASLSSEAGDFAEKLKEKGLVVEQTQQDSCSNLRLPDVIIPNDDEVCFVSNCGQGPNCFFLQLASQEDALLELNLKLGQAYSVEQKEVVQIVPGTLCCAQFELDNSWYRARIQSVHEEEEVKVMFLDYGNIETVGRGSLCPLLPQFTTTPPFAYECCLSGLKVASGEEESALQHFVDLTQDKELTVTFQGCAVGRQTYRVKLSDQDGDLTRRLLNLGLVPEPDVEDKSQDGLKLVTEMEKRETDEGTSQDK